MFSLQNYLASKLAVMRRGATNNVWRAISVLFLLWMATVRGEDDTYVAMEEDQHADYWKADSWRKIRRVEPSKTIELTIALKQRNTDMLERHLKQVSDPDSKHYGKYITIDDITRIVAPSDKHIATVRQWIEKNAPESKCKLNLNRDFLICHLTCGSAEKLLVGAHFSYYRHAELKRLYIRSDTHYHVPAYIAKRIDFVGDVHRLPSVKSMVVESENKERSESLTNVIHVYPKILRAKYNLASSDVGSHPNNSQAVSSFLRHYFSQNDVSKFMESFVGSDFAHRTKIDKIVGFNEQRPDDEAALDTEYLMSMGANISTWVWNVPGRRGGQEPFLQWMVALGNTTKIPWVHSISYADKERSLSSAYMRRISTEFMKIGLRGVTLIVASGDRGARCENTTFNPNFPGASPYITAVGATWFQTTDLLGPECAYEISGGGFSNVFKQPPYQASRVNAYLKLGKLPQHHHINKSGRAYPDVAAIGRHIIVIDGKIKRNVMGTSASTPVFAGIVSMLNEHRLRHGKPTMGFLNPFLYKNPQAFNDISCGCTYGCHDWPNFSGYCAEKGFDPTTGNGSPKYPELLKAAMKIVIRDDIK